MCGSNPRRRSWIVLPLMSHAPLDIWIHPEPIRKGESRFSLSPTSKRKGFSHFSRSTTRSRKGFLGFSLSPTRSRKGFPRFSRSLMRSRKGFPRFSRSPRQKRKGFLRFSLLMEPGRKGDLRFSRSDWSWGVRKMPATQPLLLQSQRISSRRLANSPASKPLARRFHPDTGGTQAIKGAGGGFFGQRQRIRGSRVRVVVHVRNILCC